MQPCPPHRPRVPRHASPSPALFAIEQPGHLGVVQPLADQLAHSLQRLGGGSEPIGAARTGHQQLVYRSGLPLHTHQRRALGHIHRLQRHGLDHQRHHRLAVFMLRGRRLPDSLQILRQPPDPRPILLAELHPGLGLGLVEVALELPARPTADATMTSAWWGSGVRATARGAALRCARRSGMMGEDAWKRASKGAGPRAWRFVTCRLGRYMALGVLLRATRSLLWVWSTISLAKRRPIAYRSLGSERRRAIGRFACELATRAWRCPTTGLFFERLRLVEESNGAGLLSRLEGRAGQRPLFEQER